MKENPFIHEHGEIISVWHPISSNGYTKYTTLLYKDGFMSCDCAGWCMAKKDKHTGESLPRTCTHIKDRKQDSFRIRTGSLPKVFEDTQPQTKIAPAPKREGRRIDLG
jgi:hypothetical protein